MKKPELLAPVGSFESLVAAIEAGCDAVYLSGKLYGARNFANNFSNEEIKEAIKYAHLYGIKVYVTINTLIYDAEVENFIKYVKYLYQNNVDAVIVQDLGMFDLIRKIYPSLEIHISTQMHIHNLEGCELMYKMGAKRVVLARETPIELVKTIKEKCPIDIEIFVHGALCISYSGQCLMSSLIGGRSGNRGVCAQCCRQPYDLYCENHKINVDNYLLSTKDLNTLEHIGELIDIGIDSFKIEGRMKRPEYVYYVVSLYRKAIDSYLKCHEIKITNEEITNLKKIFNRQFTKGFLFHEKNNRFVNSFRPNHLGVSIGKVISVKATGCEIKLDDSLNIKDGIRILDKEDIGMTVQTMFKNNHKIDSAKKGDIVFIPMHKKTSKQSIVLKTTDSKQLQEINDLLNLKKRKIPIKIVLYAMLDNKLKIIIEDDKENKIEIEHEYIVTKSNTTPTTEENISKQLSKLGNTVYKISKLIIKLDNNIFIPIKHLNEIRRMAIDKLNEKRLYSCKITYGKYYITMPNFEYAKNKNILIENFSNQSFLDKYNEVIVEIYKQSNLNLRKKIPRVQEHLKKETGKLLVGELGSVYKYVKDCDVATDFSLNVTNSYTVAFLHSLGIKRITLSLEMDYYQIKRLINDYHNRYHQHPNLEVITKGYPEAMILKYDLFNGKYDKNKNYYLVDKYHNKFLIKRNDNLTYIYHYEPLNINDYDKLFNIGVNNIRENYNN